MHSTTSEPQSGGDGNPYATPTADFYEPRLSISDRVGIAFSASPEKFEAVGRVMAEWELLRIPYNLLMLLAASMGISLGFSVFDSLARVLVGVVECVLFANTCFLLGHFAAGYATWLGFHRPWMTYSLFVLGTLFATGMSFLASMEPFSELHF